MYKALGGGWQMREGKDFVKEETKKEMQDSDKLGQPVVA